MLDRKLPLNALRAFEVTARHGSLTAAAGELRVSVASVSRHVALLERHFGCKLLARRRTGVELTERGRLYYNRLAEAFEILGGAGRQLGNEAPEGTLHIWLYTSFMVEWLAQRLPAFRADFPEIDLRLRIGTGEADFDCDRVDLAVTALALDDDRLHYDDLFEAVLVPVCHPRIINGIRRPIAPDWLQSQTLLFEKREALFWHQWFKAVGMGQSPLGAGIQFEAATLAYQAARSGTGIALAQTFYIAPELRNHTLVAPVPIALSASLTHRLVCRRNRLADPLVHIFRRWLLGQALEAVGCPEDLGLRLVS